MIYVFIDDFEKIFDYYVELYNDEVFYISVKYSSVYTIDFLKKYYKSIDIDNNIDFVCVNTHTDFIEGVISSTYDIYDVIVI